MRQARILILRGGAVGDFIVTLPALQALRNQWPDAYIELIGYPHVASLAKHAGLIDHLRSLDEARIARYFAWNAVLDDEEQNYFASFDIVLNYLHDPEGTLNTNLKRFGVQVLISASPMVSEYHAVDHFTRPLQSLAIYDAPAYPSLRMNPAGVTLRHTPANPWIAIHPGSGGKSKCWPVNHYIELAEWFRMQSKLIPVFLTSDVETEYIPEIDRLLAPYHRLHNLDLVTLAGTLTSARLFIGNDGGITHLAAALGCPTLALFGPSDPNLWSPRGLKVTIIQSENRRMESITLAEVMEKAGRLLGLDV